ELPKDSAEDSFSLLPVLAGEATGPIRPYLITQAFGGARTLSLREGRWKYIDHAGSGGNNYERGDVKSYALPEAEPGAPAQLYDLVEDPGEKTNLYAKRPDIAKAMKARLDQSVAAGRSRP
ncbi:MAG: hypothetical protein RI978_151, partial [Verrucomicrobiota bacterium]